MFSPLRDVPLAPVPLAGSFILGLGSSVQRTLTSQLQQSKTLEAPSLRAVSSVPACRMRSFAIRTAMKLRYGLSEHQRASNDRLERSRVASSASQGGSR